MTSHVSQAVIRRILLISYVCGIACALSADTGDCPPGYYYDTGVGRCDSCYQLCLYPDIQGTTEDCHTHCPDYNKGIHLTETSKDNGTKHTGTDDIYTTSQDTTGVIVGLTCIAVLMFIISVVMVMRKSGICQCSFYISCISGRRSGHRKAPVSSDGVHKPLRGIIKEQELT